MNRFRGVVLLATTTTSILMFAQEALAWFRVCNRSSERVSVAFAYLDVPDNREVGGSESELAVMSRFTGWVATGWYNLNPGECTNTYPHELWRRNSYYYVYAEGSRGGRWGGEHYFCIDSTNQFSWPQYRDGSCKGVRAGFLEVYIGGGKVQNYTLNLRD